MPLATMLKRWMTSSCPVYGMARLSCSRSAYNAGLADTGSTVNPYYFQVRENVGQGRGKQNQEACWTAKPLNFIALTWCGSRPLKLKRKSKAGAKKIKEVIGARVEAKVSKNKVNGKKGKTVCFDITTIWVLTMLHVTFELYGTWCDIKRVHM